jgi:hypothetical protein
VLVPSYIRTLTCEKSEIKLQSILIEVVKGKSMKKANTILVDGHKALSEPGLFCYTRMNKSRSRPDHYWVGSGRLSYSEYKSFRYESNPDSGSFTKLDYVL